MGREKGENKLSHLVYNGLAGVTLSFQGGRGTLSAYYGVSAIYAPRVAPLSFDGDYPEWQQIDAPPRADDVYCIADIHVRAFR
jgi:hypothetical protein